MSSPQVDDLQAAWVVAVGQHDEAVAGPDFILGVVFGFLHFDGDLSEVGLLEVRSKTPSRTSFCTRRQASSSSTFSRRSRPGLRMHHTSAPGYSRDDLPRVLCPLGDLVPHGSPAVPFAVGVHHHQAETGRIRHGGTIRRERFYRNARAAFELLLDHVANGRLDLAVLVEGRLAVMDCLVDLGLVEDLEAIGSDPLDEERLALQT